MDEDRVPAWEWARFLPQDRSPGPHWSHHWLIYIISSSMWCYIRSTIAFLHDDGKNLVTYRPRFCHHCCLTWRMFPITDKKKKGENGWWTCQCRWAEEVFSMPCPTVTPQLYSKLILSFLLRKQVTLCSWWGLCVSTSWQSANIFELSCHNCEWLSEVKTCESPQVHQNTCNL